MFKSYLCSRSRLLSRLSFLFAGFGLGCNSLILGGICIIIAFLFDILGYVLLSTPN